MSNMKGSIKLQLNDGYPNKRTTSCIPLWSFWTRWLHLETRKRDFNLHFPPLGAPAQFLVSFSLPPFETYFRKLSLTFVTRVIIKDAEYLFIFPHLIPTPLGGGSVNCIYFRGAEEPYFQFAQLCSKIRFKLTNRETAKAGGRAFWRTLNCKR